MLEERAQPLVPFAVARDGVIADYDQEGREVGDPHLDDSDALKALVFFLRLALDRSSDRPLSRGFLDFLRTEFLKDEKDKQSRIVLPKDCSPLRLHHSRFRRSRRTMPRTGRPVMAITRVNPHLGVHSQRARSFG